MVQYNKIIKNKKKGFTLVELMVVLAITAILAALVGGGLIAYTRLARFEKNEANARTLFQTAQISLTRMETAGELDAFRDKVTKSGSMGQHFAEGLTDADGKPLDGRTQKDLNTYIAALYYDKTGAADGNHNALVKELLGDYIYDASLLNASICVEIDVQSGQVYSVFYDTKSVKLRFNRDGATNIYDRSYDHRRNDSLVGYYSAEDRVNVVQLVQTKLKVKNPRLTNGETLTLSWSGNSSLGDLDTSYTATAYDAKDTGKTKPLFTITIKRDTAGAADDNKQVITEMPVTIYTYDNAGQQTKTEKELYFPLSYNKGSFVLTLDAMADAALLRACENDEVAATSLYSITRLLNDPKDIYIAMRAEPRENYSDTYTASKEETTNEENTLLAKGGTAVTADLKYFRHLYNLRWSADWDITNKGTYTLTPQASNSTGLNWTGGGVTVYCAAGAWPPVAKVPSLNDPVAWPTIPELGEKIELTSKTTVLATKTTRVPILNLQLSSKSVAKTGRAGKDELADHYVGLIGENKGEISYITLRDPDIQVNVKTETVAVGALPNEDQLKLTATKFVTALEDTDENWRDVRAVGALCGVNTGTLENCALTRGTNSSTSALVAAALAFGDSTTATERTAEHKTVNNKSYTYYTDEPRGIGGLVGVAIPETDSVMQNLTVASDVTVAGLLVDKDTQTVTDTAADQKAEKARYAAAAAEPDDESSLWRSVGVGGVFGTVDAAQMQTNDDTNIVNNGFVTGNGFTGGIVGNLFTTGANTGTPSLTGLRNNGTVSAGANYKGDTAGDARSLVLGQFFGGIAGYGRGVTLQGCESVTRSDLTETQLKEQVKAGFDETGTLTDASPLKGDFVGGLVGYGKDIVLEDCKTGKGYVLGSRFVGGLAGGFTGSGVKQNDTNSSDVFGSRYVGGIVSVNGSNSIINGMTNTGLVAAFGKNAAYVGGIVGVNDAGWGGSEDKTAKATVQNCANRMSGDNATDTRRINLLKELNGYADYVGGIAGSNGKNGVVTWDKSGTPTLGAILYGNNYVGGVAGYNDEKAEISNSSGQNLTISGQIVAAGKAVGGMIGLNCASTLPSATVAVSRVAGQQLVGGVIGANLPVGRFTVADGGAFNTDVASGRVEADAVAGGIIGYNRLLAAKPAGVTLAALLPTIDKSTGVLTDSTDANTSDGEVILTGFWNKLNLQANIYVGGIVGANDAKTKLTIQNATNGATQNALSVGGLNPSNNGAFKGGVSLNALAGGRYDFDDVHGALAGGIIGYATPNTTLENCINYGTVAHKCAAGGFAGWNEGTITGGRMAASLGNRETGYTYLGGVAGRNDGTLEQCTYSGTMGGNADTDGLVSVGARSTGSTVGGIAGLNNSTITGCEVKYIKLQVSGISNITTTQTADEKLASASHVGGIVGRNNAEIVNSYVATERSSGAGSIITARYGFLGGVAGSNNGTITGSGSKKALVSDEEATALVEKVENWLGAADANAGINSMAAELTTGKTYANLMGVDTVSAQGYGKVYSQSGLAANDLLVALRGSNKSETVRADGYLGGLAGFNSLRGTINTSATGKWFVYSDNATTASTVGGIVGQNESNVTDKSVLDTVVNCAAVRRFTRVFETWAWIGNQNKDDTDNENIYKGGSRVVVHVGGVIGQQQNRSDDRWSVSKVVNCGSVFNSRSANVGGVIAYWLDYGGTVQKCFNFGKITTNTNDGNPGYGAVGGVVGFIDQPISGGTTNVLSCRNYGQIWYKSNGANDCAGIIGKIEMKKVTDIMTLNIIDCVNSGAIKAESQAVGILAWIGPWNGGRIDNVTVNIDRCRNLNTNFTCSRKVGIVGSRGDGRGSNKATNVTNCFATVGTDWYPIAYLRQSYENVTGHGNYYIENSESAGKSFFKKDSRKLTTTKPAEKTGNWNSPNYDSAYNETAWYPSSEKVKAHRLYIGYNVTDEATDPYIAFLPTLAEDENGAAYSLWWISGLTSAGPSAQPNSAYIKTVGQKAYIYDDTGAGDDTNPGNQRATVMLRFGEAANSKVTNDVDITDITDEVIQNYYKYVLDSTKPAQPGEINVKASQVQDADNNVYGRYEVTWSEPNDKTASPAAYYRVEILPCDAAGTVAPDAVPYLKADVYQRSYTFVADKAWTGNFVVRVTPYNTNDDPAQSVNPRTSGVQTFMHALPTPEIEFRLVKRENGGFDWNQCQTPDEKWREFKYEVVAVMKNYTEYPTDEAWTVKLTDGKYNYYFTKNGKQYIRLTNNLERTLTLTALATPGNSTKYLRSAQYKSETYLPSQWRDHNGDSGKDEDGLPLGTLNKDGDTEYVTYTGQTAESFEATVKFSFTPKVKSDSGEHGSPTYRVMLLAKYLGNDEVNGVSLNGQYITLAARESIVTESPVTFNLNSLPSDAMTNYTDFLVVAVPVTSGKGDMKYRWDATAEEVSAAIASHANDTDKEIWWKNGYEIVRTGEHSYTYAHLTPLCFSDVSRTDDTEWAKQATQTTPQIIFKQLNLNVLKAPTLAEDTDGSVVNPANNQLTYTFKWTQDDMEATDAAPDYQIKLYGLLTDEDGNVTGQEQIALKDGVNLANEVQRSGNSFTLPVNVDTMLANGSDSWRYDKVRLEVTRVAAAGTDEIGASAVADYSVKQRLPGISAPSSITRVNGETDNADALLYTVSWSPSDDVRIDHYDLCVVDDGGNTVLTLPTTGNVGSLTLDLEQYQGKALRFRVIARRNADNITCFDGPDGALSQPETIVRRAAAPKVTASSFAPASPNQETFLNDLKLNMTLDAAAQGNVYFTGYIFSDEAKYTEIAKLAEVWQNTPTGQDKYKAQQELTKALDEMLDSGDAELVIPKDSRTVGGSASVNGTTASYTFVPDGNGFTLTPDHAKQYLLPAVRVMPTDGTTASNWFYILQDAAKAQLPAITLDAPVDTAEPERALGNAVYTQEVNLYNDPECKTSRGTAPLELRRFTVEWTAVNKYTQADGTVRNLTDSYTFTVTPLDSKTKQPYSITVTTYDSDVTDTDGKVTHKRGEIKTVTKTYDGKTTEIAKQTDDVDKETGKTRIWYDLSVEPVTDENGNVTWESQPYNVTGTVEKDGGTLYYKAQTVPMLELVQEDGAEPVYRITLPELQEKVQDDSLALQKFTASVTLQTLAHSGDNGKTVASGKVKVTVNGTNTADAAEDAQSMDSAESVAPAETAESTAAESAPASVPPVLMRARAALPMATPETAAAPDETDAAETAPPKRTETSDAS